MSTDMFEEMSAAVECEGGQKLTAKLKESEVAAVVGIKPQQTNTTSAAKSKSPMLSNKGSPYLAPAMPPQTLSITPAKETEDREGSDSEAFGQSSEDLRFQCRCDETQVGDTVCVTGNHKLLGEWGSPVELDPETYPVWKSNPLSITSPVEYKYVIKSGDGSTRWEVLEGNRTFTPSQLGQVDEPRFA